MRWLRLALVSSVGLLGMDVSGRAETLALEPVKLVRSFQRVQDAIALGDDAAIGMQRELYQIVRTELSSSKNNGELSDRNLRAILSFAIAGGGAKVAHVHRKAFAGHPDLMKVATKVRRYNGQNAAEVFVGLDPASIGGILGASIALVRAQGGEDIVSRVADLNFVRLELPGTLFEESALRALLVLHRNAGDETAFLRTASRYSRTFGNSPYAARFAEEIVKGAVEMDSEAFRNEMADVLSFLPSQRHSVLLDRIKRTATVMGKNDLFFSIEASEAALPKNEVQPVSESDDIILRAYNSIESLDAASANEMLAAVEGVIPTDLQPENRRLRGVVISLLTSIVSEPAPVMNSLPTPAVEQEMPKTDEMNAENEVAADDLQLDSFMEEMKMKIGGADKLLENIE